MTNQRITRLGRIEELEQYIKINELQKLDADANFSILIDHAVATWDVSKSTARDYVNIVFARNNVREFQIHKP